MNFVFAIISSIVASFIFELIRSNSSWFPGPSKPVENVDPVYEHPKSQDERRAQNKAKLDAFIFNAFFYFYTFLLVYMALVMPPVFTKFFNKGVIYLNDARYIGDLLPQVEITSSYIQAPFIFLTTVIYIPLLFLVSRLSVPIAAIVDKFNPVTIHRWRAIQGLLFAFLSSLLAVLSIYIFNEITLKEAIFMFALFIISGVALASKK